MLARADQGGGSAACGGDSDGDADAEVGVVLGERGLEALQLVQIGPGTEVIFSVNEPRLSGSLKIIALRFILIN